MKNFKIYIILLIGLIGFNSCIEEDTISFIAAPSGELEFSNSFLSEYILTFETSSNLAERFTWKNADFETPTNVTYELQKSLTGTESDVEVVSSTSGNDISLTISDFLVYANGAGLDNDPETEAPNTGTIYFRLRAFVGANSDVDILSDFVALTLVLPEDTGAAAVCDFDQLYAVGAGITYTSWGWDYPAAFNGNGNGLYSGNVDLTAYTGNDDGNFRFFTGTGWGFDSFNYPHFADEGYTIDENFVNAEDGDSNFRFIGTDGLYLLTIDQINKTITLTEPEATGTCDYDVLYAVGLGITNAGWGWDSPAPFFCNGAGVYSGFVDLTAYTGNDDGNFRFFTGTGWGFDSFNYPHFTDEGYTIDENFVNAEDGDSNFRFIGDDGTYLLTIDTVNKTITLE